MKVSLSKLTLVTVDIVLAVYLVMAFTSLNAKGVAHSECNKVNINIADGNTNGFIDAKEIKRRLVSEGLYPIHQDINSINTRVIAEKLKETPFVKTANCYKTQDGHLYINVTQRMPVARIKSDSGADYYVDDNDKIMPRSNYTSDLIIASGCIDQWYATNYVAPFCKAIASNELWRNLVEQVHIMPDHGVEIVPRIGDHIVYLGRLPDGKNKKKHQEAINAFVEKKFTRLEKFYKYGLNEVGWNKYSYINIEFDNQIICRKAKHSGTIDTTPEPAPQPEQASTATQEATTSTAEKPKETAEKPKSTAEKKEKTAPEKKGKTSESTKKAEKKAEKTSASATKKTEKKAQTTEKKAQTAKNSTQKQKKKN